MKMKIGVIKGWTVYTKTNLLFLPLCFSSGTGQDGLEEQPKFGCQNQVGCHREPVIKLDTESFNSTQVFCTLN